MEIVLVILYLVIIFLNGMAAGMYVKGKRVGLAILYTVSAVIWGGITVSRFVS